MESEASTKPIARRTRLELSEITKSDESNIFNIPYEVHYNQKKKKKTRATLPQA